MTIKEVCEKYDITADTLGFTKLGSLSGGSPEDIEEWKRVFGGDDDITAEFFVEWTE